MIRFLSILTLTATAWVSSAQERPPAATGQVTFLYFNDLAAADAFYGETLGLEKEFDLEWVKIYKLSPSSSVGLVNATGGAHRPSADKPVMVSMVVQENEVDLWWSYLEAKGVDVGESPGSEGDGAVRAFGFKDPEGYSLEVFAWVDK
jgi:catechol 2,3-dioxygenase-like lactoylglutathione lyase family enzyme